MLGILAVLVIIGGFVVGASAFRQPARQAITKSSNSNANALKETSDMKTANKTQVSQNDLLRYLIEEEKLAHDVYAEMYDIYGARVFGNILQSEQSHQSQVLALMNARGISDPRSSERGVFVNQELQALYNSLTAQGKQNTQEAYKVGVAIEEKDIADITTQLATATDADSISTLQTLRSASENHLRAFNRQLGK